MGGNKEDQCEELADLIVEMNRDLLMLMQEFNDGHGHVCSTVIDFKTRKTRKEKFKEIAKKFLERSDEFKRLIMRI